MSARSIAVGNGPDIETLINEWTEAGCMVESSFDGGRWWHRRISPENAADARIPASPLTLGAIVASNDPAASALINEWAGAGSAVISVPIGGLWYHRRAEPKADVR